MRVLIEASEAYRNRTGIGRFSRELIRALREYPALDLRYSPPDYREREHRHTTRTATQRLKHFAEHLALTQFRAYREARRVQPQILHSLSFFVPLLAQGVPRIETIFDMAYFDLPAETDRFWGRYARALIPVFARQSSAILTISAFSKARILHHLKVDPEKVHVVYPGVSDAFRPISDTQVLEATRRVYALPARYVLYAGAWHRPKNLPTLIRAFRGIQDATLVVTGQAFTEAERDIPRLAETLGIRAQFIGRVAEPDLPALYNMAQALVLPSLYEGFGLPVIEAMACGTPVLVSDIPILREIADAAALTFPTDSVEALHERLRMILDDPQLRAEQQAKALAQSAKFRWTETASKVIEVWRHVAARE